MNYIAFSPGPIEIGVIIVVLLLLFGKRLPDVGRSLGKGLVEFKKGVKGVEEQVTVDVDSEVHKQIDKEKNEVDNNDSDSVFCPECAHKNLKNATFCSSCGKEITKG